MNRERVDIVLVGAGIMSATLGILLKQLMPEARLCILESLDKVAAESSDAWNNAGTGHSAFCELNYTPLVEGEVDIRKALDIAQRFEVSKQLWAYLKEQDWIPYEVPFIHPIPHMSLVWGEDNVAFLRQRFEAMQQAPIFEDMRFSIDRNEIAEWAPLMMERRDNDTPLAATKMAAGTDVNFGAITRAMVDYLEHSANVAVYLGHSVVGFARQDDGRWRVEVEERGTKERREVDAGRVFIGAGGGSFSLLHKTGIPEAQGYGGFPVSGQFLQCTNDDVIQRHNAKVYGKAAVGSPPMSVPHLDTRIIDGERTLFFGPYAGFSTKFLKSGSYLDLPLSIEMHNVWPLLAAGFRHADLTKYLIKQVVQSHDDRFAELLRYYPGAEKADWKLAVAGQRVQVIKKDKDSGGMLKFGTEIVCSADGSITALLGASPGASTSVSIMLEVVERMFPEEIASGQWQQSIREMIPTYGESLIDDGDLCRATRARTGEILGL
jgi:malate dehydrogenase (quinone)